MEEGKVTRRAFLGAACAGVAGAALPARAQGPAPTMDRPNIVVVVLDTARRDHFSCYGYHRPTTPFIDSLLPCARSYDQAYSTSCWTVPSHASLFTGLYPVSHGTTWEHVELDKRQQTLVEILQKHGYRTLGFCENPIIGPSTGFSRGFETFSVTRQALNGGYNPTLTQFTQSLREHDTRPFFAFINFVAPHDPYNSSGQFFLSFLSDKNYAGQYKIDVVNEIVKGLPLDAKWLEHLTEHYDAEVRYSDYLLSKTVDVLQTEGYWDRTLFVVLSDHGENLGDHGFLNHQFCLYESLIRIPIIIHYPDRFPEGSVETRPVQINDLFPTLIEAAGIDPADYPHQAHSLFPDAPIPDRLILAETYVHTRFNQPNNADKRWNDPRMRRFKRRLKSLRMGSMKLIHGSDNWFQLFDLDKDPDELHDLTDQPTYAAMKDNMSRRLNTLLSRLQVQRPRMPEKQKEMEEETKDALEAMGYF